MRFFQPGPCALPLQVFLIGNSGVEEELSQHGIPFVGGERFELPYMGDMDAIKGLKVSAA